MRRNYLLALVLACLLLAVSITAVAETITLNGDKVKISSTTEKEYTYADLENRLNVLKGERDRAQSNLNLLNASVEEAQKRLDDAVKAGLKPIEAKETNNEVINKGE